MLGSTKKNISTYSAGTIYKSFILPIQRTGMRYQAKLLTLSPQIVLKKSYLSILVNDEF